MSYHDLDVTADYEPVQVFPQKQTARETEEKHFTCLSRDTTRWSFEGDPLPSNAITRRATTSYQHILKLYNISRSNSGRYRCQGRDASNVAEGVLEVTSNGKEMMHSLLASEVLMNKS